MKLRELTKALTQGKDVRWASDGYKVWWDGDRICVTHENNGFNCALDISEVERCYIKEELET